MKRVLGPLAWSCVSCPPAGLQRQWLSLGRYAHPRLPVAVSDAVCAALSRVRVTLDSSGARCHFWLCARRLEDHDELQGADCLSHFDKRIVAAIDKLKQMGRWEELVNDGGSPEAALRVSPLSPEVCFGMAPAQGGPIPQKVV